MSAETSNAIQSDWDRMLVVNFWPCFTERRVRWTNAVARSFAMVHGSEVRVDRFPPPFVMRKHFSQFVCSQLPALADRLINADGNVDIEETVRWIQRANLQCTGKTRRLPSSDRNELRRTVGVYDASVLARVGYREFCAGELKMGGGSKRATRHRMLR